MKKIAFVIAFLLSVTLTAQENTSWGSYFSYNNIVDMTQSGSRVYAGGESAMFYQNVINGELKTITSVDGLKAEGITAIHYSSTYNKTLVGSSNGLLLIVNADNTINTKIDIIEETTIAANIKKINNISEYNGIAYISCDFGIATLNMNTLQFGDSYYIGPGGQKIKVFQTAVVNNTIYAATENNGLRSAGLDNPNLVDFSQWTETSSGNWLTATSHSDRLVASYINNTVVVYFPDENIFGVLATGSRAITDLNSSGTYLVATSETDVFVFNAGLQVVAHVTQIPNHDVTFTSGSVVNERLYIGTREQGVFSAPLNNTFSFTNITPAGPEQNEIFSMHKANNALWTVYGAYSYAHNPYPLKYAGVSRLAEDGWFTLSNEEVFSAASISDVITSPNNESIVYASSYHSGLVKIEGDAPALLYNNTNTGNNSNGLETMNTGGEPSIRINSLAFDGNGSLWMTNSRVERPLKVLRSNNSWVSYDFTEITSNTTGDDYEQIVIDRNNTKWIATRLSGLVAFNENLNNKSIVINASEGNLPDRYVKSLAIDNNNRLWIGTVRGLRVLPSVESFTTESELTTNAIIITDDDLAQELMYEQTVTAIEVDGSNNKWLGTTAGAFLVSPDGQRTLFHFTKDNSPLPSNIINDIAIDQATGEVFFATERGLVSYKGTSTAGEDNLNNVYVYPNPVRPGFDGEVKISGLMDNVNLKITDIEGNLVFEATSEGGTVTWDTSAFGRYKVRSGVYMIFIASDDGTKTKVKKVMIVR